MAYNFQSSNRISSLSLRQFSFCIALVWLLKIHQVSGIECGTVDFLAPGLEPRIINGTRTRRAEWPFVAALYLTNTSEYFCGGTVISNRHVLTGNNRFVVALLNPQTIPKFQLHIAFRAQKLTESNIEVRLGAHNLTAKDEEGVVQRNVNKIHVHPDWKANEENYDADIAILELNDNVFFSSYIIPICLPADDAIVSSALLNITGVIVGWGLDRNGSHEEILQSADIRGLNDSYCYRKNFDIVRLSSDRTFCGIGVESAVGTPNRGDSGGGFFYDSGEVYEQYGIISSIQANSTGHVVQKASVYTNVRSFKDWIVTTLMEAGEARDMLDKIVLSCSLFNGYDCTVIGMDIRTENTVVDSFTDHKFGKSDEDVKMITFMSSTMHYLPNGIGKLFKNLEKLQVFLEVGLKLITQANFQNMEKLRELTVLKNEIEILPFDTLWELPVLEKFTLDDNKLKALDERTFEKNDKLKSVDLYGNPLEFLPRDLFKTNRLLEFVQFDGHAFKNIAIDFSALTNVNQIYLGVGTGCINRCYSREKKRICGNDLVEFQREITTETSGRHYSRSEASYESKNGDHLTDTSIPELHFTTNNPFRLNAPPPPIETLHFDSRYLQTFTSQNIVNSGPRSFTYDGCHRPTSATSFGQGNGIMANDSSRSIGPIALPNGIIQLCLRNGIRVDMTLDKAVRVTNTLSEIVISLSSGGDSAAVNHPNGKVYQLGPFVEIIAFDGKMNNNYIRYAKMWQEGITFTCTDCTHIFLVDLYGTRTITDTFTNMSCDYTLPVFLNSKHGPMFANEARIAVQRSSYFHSNDGTDEFYINDFRISQKTDGLVKVTRSNNRCLIRTSPEHHSATLTTAHIHCTASLSHTPHLFVRRQEQSMHFDGSSFVVRNNGHSAGFDENNYLRVY